MDGDLLGGIVRGNDSATGKLKLPKRRALRSRRTRAKQPINTQVPNSGTSGPVWIPTSCPYRRAGRSSNES